MIVKTREWNIICPAREEMKIHILVTTKKSLKAVNVKRVNGLNAATNKKRISLAFFYGG